MATKAKDVKDTLTPMAARLSDDLAHPIQPPKAVRKPPWAFMHMGVRCD